MKTSKIDETKLSEGYSFTPLPNYLRQDHSDIHGTGIFTNEDIPKGTLIFHKMTHIYLPSDDIMVGTFMGSLLNHAGEDANGTLAEVENDTYKSYYFKTLRDISKDEELTLNYHNELCKNFNK